MLDYFNTYKNFLKKKDTKIKTHRQRKKHKIEIHHVLPKSMGGKNEDSNYAYLTHMDHIMAHILYLFACLQRGIKVEDIPMVGYGKHDNLKNYDLTTYWNPVTKIRISIKKRNESEWHDMKMKDACRFFCKLQNIDESVENINRCFSQLIFICLSNRGTSGHGFYCYHFKFKSFQEV